MKKQLLLILLGCLSLGIQAQQSSNNIKHIELQEKKIGKSQDLELEGAELLAAHELKSNETYDFKNVSIEAENEFATVSNSDDLEVIETSDKFIITSYPDPINDPIKTIFKSDPNKKPTDKKQKTKRKKNGTGLLIAGTVLYVALQLLK